MAAPMRKVVNQGVIDLMARRSPVKQNTDWAQTLKQKVNERLVALEKVRWSWWGHWRDLSRWIQPRLGRFLESPNEGSRGRPKNQRIIDSTATTSAERCASGLMAGVSSPARPWFKVAIGFEQFAEGSAAKKWLAEIERRMRLILNEGNFYRSIATVYEEIVVFGTGAMLIYEDFDDVARFFPLAAGEYYVWNDGRLEPGGLGRKIVMTVAELVERFGLLACSETVQRDYKEGLHDNEYMVGHLIMRNDDRVYDAPDAKGRPWVEVYWEWAGGADQLLEVKGYHYKPFAVARWNVTANDAYGRSPGMTALGDVKQLQITQKRKAQLIDKLVNPPLVADAVLENKPASAIPGAVTFLPTGQSGVGFKPVYEVKPEALPAITKDIAETQQRIKATFFEDLFLMISQLDTVRTATEIAERKEEKMLMLGPALERLHDELLRVVIERLWDIMLRNHLVPTAPAEIQGKNLTIEFVSTLAQAQKAVATTAIERLFAFAGGLVPVFPQAADKLDVDAAIDEYAEAIGTTPTIVVSAEKVAAVRAARAKQQQAASALQATQALAASGKILSETDVGGGQNALAKMTGMAA